MTYLDSANRTFSNQINALSHLQSSLDANFSKACDVLISCKGKVVVSGMGKSGHIGNKIAATLASTGTPSFFMHPGEANHGDFGMLSKDDVLIAISNSGETSELVGLMPAVKRLGIPIIAVTNKAQSSLSAFADINLWLNVSKEACSLGLAPTTSTTATLVLGDAIAIALLEAKGFTAQDFAFSHPGGALGKRLLLKVEDIMVGGDEIPIVDALATLSSALMEMSSKGLGMTAIVDQGVMIGIYTDGDLRRTFDKKIDVHQTSVRDVMTPGGISLRADSLAIDALNLMQEKRINALIVTDQKNIPVGALSMHMLLRAGVV
ncbi:KpsF/GutQ family sugar-phosphate isomerase [Glaciecola sp. XM2]|jgi:arabinose-5-phosphate isomerase|uniref:KpsF/GutQ family sugar-phosphate isomerase n=1 Tax=Glaciecola sp. XM2 TaxID=1914931 RepID=UPI001BDF6A06|nr:KpsF/GutQ family sugar-phosphate isomerase [Glaciecola sp. XM2]MBT1452481.1 KpsF/GutQ family sugar-phosphate isomerase [Glaciecola sp. XM2]